MVQNVMGKQTQGNLTSNVLFLYTSFFQIVSRRSEARGLDMPLDCPLPSALQGLNIDDEDGFNKISEAMKMLVSFTQKNGLRGNTSDEQIEQMIDKNAGADNEIGTFLRKFAVVEDAAAVALKVRKKIAVFVDFIFKRNAILNPIYEERHVIEEAGVAIEKAGFPVDGRKLIRNYLNMAAKNADKAYKILVTNPATFAPIQTKDVKKNVMKGINPEEGRHINKKLAGFLKSLKV